MTIKKVRLDDFPAQWIFYLALTGGHNNLPKPKGVGPVTAWKIINQGTIEKYFKNNAEFNTVLKYIKLPYDNNALISSQREHVCEILAKRQQDFSKISVDDLFVRHGIKIDKSMKMAFDFLRNGKFTRGQ